MADETNQHGLYFPIVLDGGAPVKPSLEDSLDSSLRIILSWPYFNRYFTERFGSVLYQLISSPNSSRLYLLVRRYVVYAIEKWETRIIIQSVELITNDDGDALEINIAATIKDTDQIYNYTTQI